MNKLTYLLKNIIHKIDQSINVEEITNPEIDALFGSASGTGTDAQDYIVEHAVSYPASDGTLWTYFKYASGLVTMWGYKSVANHTPYNTVAFSSTVNGYGHQESLQYPFTLTGIPMVLPDAAVADAFTFSTILDAGIYTDHVVVYSLALLRAGDQRYVVRCHLIGTWK